MNSTYLPDCQYEHGEFHFVEDTNFFENSIKSLRPYLKPKSRTESSSEIRQCVTDKDRIFAYLDRPNMLIELNDKGEFIRKLEFFSQMHGCGFAYGSMALNDSTMIIEDYRGPPNLYMWPIDKPEFAFREQYVNEVRLYLFNRKDNFKLEEIGVLKHSVGELVLTNSGRLFGFSNKLYPRKVEIKGKTHQTFDEMHIIELTRNKELSPNSLEDECSCNLVSHTNPKPKAYYWTEQELFVTDHFRIQPLIKTLDSHVFYYDTKNKKTNYLTKNQEGCLNPQEKTDRFRTANRFVFLEDFVVCLIHEYHGENTPYKEKIILKGEDYGEQPKHFFYSTEIAGQSIGRIFEPLLNNTFIIDHTPWKYDESKRDFVEWGPPTLRKFRIEHKEHFDKASNNIIEISNGQFPERCNLINEIVHN